MTDEIRWSPYSREACTIELDDGRIVGLGAQPALDVVPGAWNIFWLTFEPLDQIAYYRGVPAEYPVASDVLAICVGAALQALPAPMQGRTVGELAATTTPGEFTEILEGKEDFLPFVFFGSNWFDVARWRAETYRVDNVVHFDFKRGGGLDEPSRLDC